MAFIYIPLKEKDDILKHWQQRAIELLKILKFYPDSKIETFTDEKGNEEQFQCLVKHLDKKTNEVEGLLDLIKDILNYIAHKLSENEEQKEEILYVFGHVIKAEHKFGIFLDNRINNYGDDEGE
jgi:predicted Ser/Thr protein kinase